MRADVRSQGYLGVRLETTRTVIATTTLVLALVTTGLSAGFFYGWQVASIPGHRLLSDVTYIQTMNAVNATIQNAGFGLIFFGSAFFIVLALTSRIRAWRSMSFILICGSLAFYMLGLMLITFGVHVPLNTELLSYADLSNVNVEAVRKNYEARWNAWHLVRTYAAVGSFVLLLGAMSAELHQPKRLK